MSLKDDLIYLRQLGGYIALSVVLFFGTALMGYLAASQDQEFIDLWLKELEMLKWIAALPPWKILIVIFAKNLLACAMAILLGLGLGLIPMLVVTSNGIVLGVVSYQVIHNQGVAYLAAGILPHGIIELPVVLVSIAMGLRLGHLLLLSLIGEKTDLRKEAFLCVRFLLLWAAPLLLLAAAIESFITPIAISLASR
ncbi:MAG: hypothetical protein A4E45_01399 [Methanosaeta sp. PtaB.Bin039]|nr:MAG: hypothetical protein A4E45_01399 [Methanosaeta sp. PtaB.Bin039]OPY47657.1 MAG: hypothetical protein A4E47_00174 [Methanosaeta sp. PtaU1.Bin028]HOT06742.1 stage II sporulation protein M [Methanotrichaceae archaeon]HQF16392.1 stage II sporulation protein M [Methanotrichaceae archaeon]HQI90994.1 stage II sporulation protein M [Methanotrichaceae archaeon]